MQRKPESSQASRKHSGTLSCRANRSTSDPATQLMGMQCLKSTWSFTYLIDWHSENGERSQQGAQGNSQLLSRSARQAQACTLHHHKPPQSMSSALFRTTNNTILLAGLAISLRKLAMHNRRRWHLIATWCDQSYSLYQTQSTITA